jgi:predicted ATPase
VLTTARPELLERRPAWPARTLDPLTDEEVARLLRALVPDDVDRSTRDGLVRLVGGNPLYAEEYARSLAAGAAPTLPPSVQAVIAARVDTLPVAEKAVLQDAAVVGRVVWPGALPAIGGTDRATVAACLELLVRKQFVRREEKRSLAAEPAYSFGHVLVRDVAYGQLTRTLRAERHRRAAEWLDAEAAGSGD